jgi:acyl-CoA thioesterase
MEDDRRQRILAQLKFDRFAGMLGIEVVALDDGYAKCRMPIRPEMLNSVDILHGGAIFTLADMAFAAACNSHGTVSLALHVGITYYAAPPNNCVLIAEAKEINLGRKTCEYEIRITTEEGQLIANAIGLAYRKSDPYPPLQ